MNIYTFEARDTVLFRDARPFTGSDGAYSMDAPWPSTVAGMFRTRLGQSEDGKFDITRIPELLNTSVIGPWLVELDSDGNIFEIYVPAPHDSVFFSDSGGDASIYSPELARYRHYQLTPTEAPIHLSDLYEGDGAENLRPLSFAKQAFGQVKGKPASGPRWWSWTSMSKWLAEPDGFISSTSYLTYADLRALGAEELESEERVHVAIDADTLTASEGMLFVTSMRRMTQSVELGAPIRRFAFAGGVETPLTLHESGEFVALGGERRLSTMRSANGYALPEPVTITSKMVRVILVTPALFQDGWRPSKQTIGDAELVGAAVQRWQSVSGWDFQRNQPKAARRVAPAGSVYWLEFKSTEAAQEWANKYHFKTISDASQDALDGFGLCLVGNL